MNYLRDEGAKMHSNEVRLENALVERWGLKGVLERKKVGLEGVLSKGWELKDALKRKQKAQYLVDEGPKTRTKEICWWDTSLSKIKVMHYDQYACILTWEI